MSSATPQAPPPPSTSGRPWPRSVPPTAGEARTPAAILPLVRLQAKLSTPRIYRQLVTLWIALSVGGIATGFIVWDRLNRSVVATMENAQFELELAALSSLLQRAETSQRGYLLTGDEAYLAPFGQAETAIPLEFDRLGKKLDGNATILAELHTLRDAALQELAALRRSINESRNGRLGPAQFVAHAEEGEAAMERFRALVTRVNHRARDVILVHSGKTRQEIQRALFATIAAGLVGLGAGLLALHLSRLALKQESAARLLAEQAMRVSHVAQERNTFLANMSHEIRTPMNAILGFSDLLTAALPPESKSFHYARSIRESSHSLLQLINDILDLAKIESGLGEQHLEPTDLRELVGFVRTVFAQQAARRDLKLAINLASDLPPALLLDHSRLRQVLINLMGNALKFTEHGGVTLQVAWDADPAPATHGTLRIAVADTGVGIPPDRLDDVFQPFVQVDIRGSVEQQGTGLGLSIVRRLMERMGGTVTIESAVGRGSTFHLRFPHIALSTRLPAGVVGDQDEAVDFNSIAPVTLLVVDDNVVNRELLAGLFDYTHHTLRYAANGRESVESVRLRVPHLVLMDIRMPEMDGRTALAEIRKIPGAESIPVVAVTASNLQAEESGLRTLFAGYVRKPYTRQQLFDVMKDLLPAQPLPAPRPAAPAVRPAPAPADLPAPAVLPVPSHTERRDTWSALVKALRQIEATRWQAVCESGAIFETREFARHLADLGRAAGCAPLVDYAASLTHDAETYAIASLNKHLDEFPMVIQSIHEQAPPLAV